MKETLLQKIHQTLDVIREYENNTERNAEATTDVMFEMAKEDVIRIIEKNKDLTTMTDLQKTFVIKLMCERIFDKYMLQLR